MSITPIGLLDWATCQPLEKEEACRACVSRAYYAAFHDCEHFHALLPAPGIAPPRGGMHDLLLGRLQNPAPEIKDEFRLRSKRRAQSLRALKHLRVTADYQLAATVTDADARNAIAKASQLIHI